MCSWIVRVCFLPDCSYVYAYACSCMHTSTLKIIFLIICIYACVYVCMRGVYTSSKEGMCIHIHAHVCIHQDGRYFVNYLCVCMRVYVYVGVYIQGGYVYIYMHMYAYIRMEDILLIICVYSCVYMCLWGYTWFSIRILWSIISHEYIYIYIYTYTHTYIQ
jgi:hypothetical protein